MRKTLLATLAAAFTALILLFGFSTWLFSRNMGQARHKSEIRMTALANYISEHIREDVFSYPFQAQPEIFPLSYAEEQNRWMVRLIRATGLERVVVTDSIGKVYVGSHNLINTGDDITPYLLQPKLFKQASSENQEKFTPLIVIDGVNFQSLYFPFKLNDHRYMIVLESDQNFIAYVEQFRNYLWFASLFLLSVFTLLGAGLFALDRKFQKATAEARRNERLAFLGRTSAELAHELKNPLAIIKASVDVLRKKLDPDKKEPAFGFLSEETMRLARLIGNILGFSKERELEHKPFQPRGALTELREFHRMNFPQVNWEIDIPSDLMLIGDRDAFRQIADNLARNASNAMQKIGTIKITYEQETKGKNAGRLLFSDSGPGFPKGLRVKMFEPFVSGSKTGIGLGLSIVKSLSDQLGFKIELISDAAKDKQPTCFALTIPKKLIAVSQNNKPDQPLIIDPLS